MSNLSDLLPSGGGQNIVDFTATGSLSSGQAVALKSDGTVSAISPIVGSTTTFDAAAQSNTINSAIFDPDTNKIVIAYRDVGDDKKGKCVIGTVSGSSISFGTPVTFETSQTDGQYSAAYDEAADKVVVAYQLSSNSHLVIIIGTVSGDSISFGSKFESSRSASYSDAVYDANAGKVLLAYTDSLNNAYPTLSLVNISGTTPTVSGTTVAVSSAATEVQLSYDTTASKTALCITGTDARILGYVLTNSSSSITVGSGTVLSAGATEANSVYIPDINRHVVIYHNSSTLYGTYVIFEVSGTSIANQTGETTYNSVSQGYIQSTIAYDTNADKVFIVYRKDSTTKNAVARTGTASTTALTLGDEITLNSATNSNNTAGIQATFDSNANRIVCSQGQDQSANTDANAFVFDINGGPANTDFIGLTNAAISNGATGKVNVKGSINSKQSSLTIGSDYYVQADGSVSTTSTSPAVKIGQAVTATTINLMDLT